MLILTGGGSWLPSSPKSFLEFAGLLASFPKMARSGGFGMLSVIFVSDFGIGGILMHNVRRFKVSDISRRPVTCGEVRGW